MTLIKDLNELHISLRSFLFSILFIMPFWYISIYLFHKQFFTTAVWYLPIVFSFCLTIVFYMPYVLFALLYNSNQLDLRKKIPKPVKPEKKDDNSITSTFFLATLIYLIVHCSFISSGLKHKYTFYKFVSEVEDSLIYLSAFALALLLTSLIPNRQKKEVKKEETKNPA